MRKWLILLFLCVLSSFAYGYYNTTDMTLYWAGDNNHKDQFLDFDGSPTSNGTSPSTTTGGFIDGAYDFDGGNDGVVFNGIDLESSEFAVFLWVNITGSGGTDNIAESDTRFRMKVDNNDDFVCLVYDAGAGAHTTVKSDLHANSWEFVGCSWNGTHICSYHNGSLVDCQASPSIHASDADLVIGYEYAWANHYNGQMDELMVWNRSIDATEATQMYNSGLLGIQANTCPFGQCYFSSVNGNQNGYGNATSPFLDWSRLDTLYKTDDIYEYYFEKGSHWYMENSGGTFNVPDGMSYYNYGTGDLPILDSNYNISSLSCWSFVSGNLYESTCYNFSSQITAIYDYDANPVTKRVLKRENSLSGLDADKEYYWNSTTGKVIIYSDTGAPFTTWGEINLAEFNVAFSIIGTADSTIKGLHIRGSGRGGIGGYSQAGNPLDNITITGNIVDYHGTNYCTGAGECVPGTGNGIGTSLNQYNITVTHNNVSHAWDACASPQAWSSAGQKYLNTINYSYNILQGCPYPIEYFNSFATSETHNLYIEHNTLDPSGSAWDTLKAQNDRCMRITTHPATSTNTYIRDNLCVNSTYYAFEFNQTGLWTGPSIINYNYFPATYTTFALDSGSNINFATWQGKGYDANSTISDPSMLSNYKPYNSQAVCTASSEGSYVGAVACISNITLRIKLDTPIVSTTENNWVYVNVSCSGDTLERFNYKIVRNSPNSNTAYYQNSHVGLSGGTKTHTKNITNTDLLIPNTVFNETNLYYQNLTCRFNGVDTSITAPLFNLERNVTTIINSSAGLIQNYSLTVNSTTVNTTTSSVFVWLSSGAYYNFISDNLNYLQSGENITTFTLPNILNKYISPSTGNITLNTTAHISKVNVNLENIFLTDNSNSLDCYANISMYNNTNTVLSYWWTNSTNDTIKTGTKQCEHENICTVDVLNNTYIEQTNNLICNINYTVDSYTFTYSSEQLNKSSVGLCSGTRIYPVANVTYYNEQTDENINASVLYNVLLYDGTVSTLYGFNVTNQYYTEICTDINPADNVITLLLYGNITLSKTGYNTRILSIPYNTGYTVSNDPMTNISLYMQELGNSTTVTYNWYTTSYEPINGNMIIYRCEGDGSKTLVDAPYISDGVANAEITPYTTAYSYSVVIDGTKYTDNSYSACHVESTTERTFFVDTTAPELLAVAQIYGSSCRLWQSDTDEVKLSWDADETLEACIEAHRQTVTGSVQVYESCINGTDGTMTRTITNNTQTYIVKGSLSDGTYKIYCKDTVVVTVKTDAQSATGVYGAFAAGFMILAFALLFSPNGQLQIIGSVFAVIVAFGLGIIAFGWAAVVMLISFLLAALIIGRYRRKE